jgi:ABC-type nickel/cobalt efflux system permease component RcnA
LNFLFLLSAGFVGLVHSLAPGHWLPVVLMAKTRRWKLGQAVLGAVVAAFGHILVSIALAFSGIELAEHMVEELEHRVEQYSGWALLVFGLAYAGWSYTRHSHCHGHTQRNYPFNFSCFPQSISTN